MTGSVQAALQAAGFGCVTAAALLAAKALWGRPSPRNLEAWSMHCTRAGFLLLGGALAAGFWRTPDLERGLRPTGFQQQWGLLCWLIFFAVLHGHRVKAFKGRPALAAGIAGWAVAAGAWLVLR